MLPLMTLVLMATLLSTVCKIDLLTCIQNLVKLSLTVFEVDSLFSHVSSDGQTDGWTVGRSDGRTVFRMEKVSRRGALLLKKCVNTFSILNINVCLMQE